MQRGKHSNHTRGEQHRCFVGRVRTVGRRTAHVETLRADGRVKLRYVKLARLWMEGGAWR